MLLFLIAVAPQTAQAALAFLLSPPLSWLIALTLWALFYHGLNGVRHLVWDAGYGFAPRSVTFSGWLVVLASMGMTLWLGGDLL